MTDRHQAGEILLGRFFLVRELGRDDSSTLWLAEDQNLGEHVALRLLDPALASAESARERIRSACRDARRLAHPHILRCYDFHADPDLCLISRQYEVGTNFSALAGRPHQELVSAVLPLVDALHYAHQQGVVHGDLKASKIVGGSASGWRLADFGVARAANPAAAGGTPQPREDIAALGRLLQTLLVETEKRDQVPAELKACIRRMVDDSGATGPRDMAALRRDLEPFATAADDAKRPTVDSHADFTAIEPVSFRVELPDTAGSNRPPLLRRRRTLSRWALAAFALAVATAVGVFVYLPDWIAERRARVTTESDATPALAVVQEDREPGGSTPAPVESPAPLSEETKQLLVKVLSKDQELRAVGVEIWGGPDFQRASEIRRQGETALQARDETRAKELLQSALDVLGDLQRKQSNILAATLEEAKTALAGGMQQEAERLYALALQIDPGNSAATKGAARAGRLDEVMRLTQAGSEAEKTAKLEAARDAYRSARDIDPLWEPASDGLARVDAELAQQTYTRAMARAVAAVEKRNLSEARDAYRAALAARPDSKEARNGAAEVEGTLRAQRAQRLRRQAEQAERDEDWAAAVIHYRAIVNLGVDVASANSGVQRCQERAELAERMAPLIEQPRRLFDPTTMSEAMSLVARVEQLRPGSPRLDAQRARLAKLITEASTPIRVVLESDNQTAITIQRLGDLGTFERQELMLRPGTYVVRGARRGYRDVRHKITVVPGQAATTVTVRCSEEI